jgi:hypothetical protein
MMKSAEASEARAQDYYSSDESEGEMRPEPESRSRVEGKGENKARRTSVAQVGS